MIGKFIDTGLVCTRMVTNKHASSADLGVSSVVVVLGYAND